MGIDKLLKKIERAASKADVPGAGTAEQPELAAEAAAPCTSEVMGTGRAFCCRYPAPDGGTVEYCLHVSEHTGGAGQKVIGLAWFERAPDGGIEPLFPAPGYVFVAAAEGCMAAEHLAGLAVCAE